MKLSKDLREFIGLLNAANVNYVVVGGHAVGFHGHPRFTGDVDFFIERSEENAAKIEKAVADFGFAGMGLTKKNFLDPDAVIQLGRPPNRIDLLTRQRFAASKQTRRGPAARYCRCQKALGLILPRAMPREELKRFPVTVVRMRCDHFGIAIMGFSDCGAHAVRLTSQRHQSANRP